MARRRLLMLLLAAIFLLVAWRLGAFELFRDPNHVKETLLGLGLLGYVAYVLAFGFVQPFGVPGTVFIIGASLVWPPPVAIALSLVGSGLSTINGFSFARYIAREWVEKKMPARFRQYDDKLADRGFVTVLLLRLVLWMNASLTAVLGVSRVRFWTHFVASMLAYVPIVVALTYFGDAAFSVLKNQPRERWIAGLGICAAVLGVVWVVRNQRRKRTVTVTEVELPSGD